MILTYRVAVLDSRVLVASVPRSAVYTRCRRCERDCRRADSGRDERLPLRQLRALCAHWFPCLQRSWCRFAGAIL